MEWWAWLLIIIGIIVFIIIFSYTFRKQIPICEGICCLIDEIDLSGGDSDGFLGGD